jgi:hypothetical protein
MGQGRLIGTADDPAVQAVAARALDLIEDGARIGLGSGRAAAAFARRLAERVRAGLRMAAVPTSGATERLARDLGIPLIALDEGVELDLTVDGADEVAPNLDLVKGWGGALVRERIVAAASRRQVILVGQREARRRARAARAHPARADPPRARAGDAAAARARAAARGENARGRHGAHDQRQRQPARGLRAGHRAA